MVSKFESTRREFLKTATAAAAAPYVITSAALGNDERAPASDRIVMGGIGIGNMGAGDQNAFLGRGDVQYVATCDVRKGVREAAKAKVDGRYKNNDCQAYNDFRELLARDDIDAVHVATPDHWHAIMVIEACRSGKDVYCQKPETRTLREGPLMVEAARRYARVVSGGSQPPCRKIIEASSISAGAANWDRSSPSMSTSARFLSRAICPHRRRPTTSTGTCGSGRPPGPRTMRPAVPATSPPPGTAGDRISTTREAA